MTDKFNQRVISWELTEFMRVQQITLGDEQESRAFWTVKKLTNLGNTMNIESKYYPSIKTECTEE